jgi:hypothetical protein
MAESNVTDYFHNNKKLYDNAYSILTVLLHIMLHVSIRTVKC